MTKPDKASEMDETAREITDLPEILDNLYFAVELNNTGHFRAGKVKDGKAMARLWLLLPEIRDTVQQYWDVDHADPNGDELEKFLARLADEALEQSNE